MASKAIPKNTNLKPIVSFGLITDIHYVNNDDRWNYSKTFLRRYRNSLKLVNQACDYWLNSPQPISFVLQLGDLIDGLCETNKTSQEDLQTILKQFEQFPRIYHLWGNHELYNFHRNDLLNSPLCSFNIENISPAHYGTIEVCSNLRIVALDTYELSLLGVQKDSEAYRQALDEFRRNNSNEKVNEWTGLEGFNKRFTQLNGGLTEKQLHWLDEQLTQARIDHANVVVIGKYLPRQKRLFFSSSANLERKKRSLIKFIHINKLHCLPSI